MEITMSIIPPPVANTEVQPPAIGDAGITPDTQVTKINIDRCEAFLRKEGFFAYGKQPDELNPYYEMYMQVVALRDKQNNASNETNRSTIIDGKVGPIMSQPVIEFHSMNGMDMYKGRKAEGGKSFIPGFFACAGALSKAVSLSNRGNPWADFHLLLAYAYMQQFEKDLIGRMDQLDGLRIERMKLVHRELSWTTPRPEEIARPHDPIFISTQYANLLLDLLVLADRCTIRYRHAQLNNLIPSKEAIFIEINRLMKQWRSISFFIWSGTRLFLERESIIGAKRENSTNAVPAELEAFVKQHFRIPTGSMPDPIWQGAKLPPHLGR